MMGKRDDAEFLALDVVNDAVRKTMYREAPPVPPRCTKLWMHTKKVQRALKLRDESKAEFSIGFSGIVDSSIG